MADDDSADDVFLDESPRIGAPSRSHRRPHGELLSGSLNLEAIDEVDHTSPHTSSSPRVVQHSTSTELGGSPTGQVPHEEIQTDIAQRPTKRDDTEHCRGSDDSADEAMEELRLRTPGSAPAHDATTAVLDGAEVPFEAVEEEEVELQERSDGKLTVVGPAKRETHHGSLLNSHGDDEEEGEQELEQVHDLRDGDQMLSVDTEDQDDANHNEDQVGFSKDPSLSVADAKDSGQAVRHSGTIGLDSVDTERGMHDDCDDDDCEECRLLEIKIKDLEEQVRALQSALAAREATSAKLKAVKVRGGVVGSGALDRNTSLDEITLLRQEIETLRVTCDFLFRQIQQREKSGQVAPRSRLPP